MRLGVPKEIKDSEWRVGLTPGSVEELARHGHNDKQGHATRFHRNYVTSSHRLWDTNHKLPGARSRVEPIG